MRIALPDGCRGVDDPNTGRIYRPKSMKSGHVEIQDPVFAKAAKQQLGEVGLSLFASSDLPTWSCRCGRTNWEQDNNCRRCGESKPHA